MYIFFKIDLILPVGVYAPKELNIILSLTLSYLSRKIEGGNTESKLLVAFSIYLQGGTNIWAEYTTLQYGLHLAEVDDLQNVIVEVDSMLQVISAI